MTTEVTQYTVKVPIEPGPGITSRDHLDLTITKKRDSSQWVVDSHSLMHSWVFVSLEVAKERVSKELVPLIQEYFKHKAAADYAYKALDAWEYSVDIIHAKSNEPAKVGT